MVEEILFLLLEKILIEKFMIVVMQVLMGQIFMEYNDEEQMQVTIIVFLNVNPVLIYIILIIFIIVHFVLVVYD